MATETWFIGEAERSEAEAMLDYSQVSLSYLSLVLENFALQPELGWRLCDTRKQGKGCVVSEGLGEVLAHSVAEEEGKVQRG